MALYCPSRSSASLPQGGKCDETTKEEQASDSILETSNRKVNLEVESAGEDAEHTGGNEMREEQRPVSASLGWLQPYTSFGYGYLCSPLEILDFSTRKNLQLCKESCSALVADLGCDRYDNILLSIGTVIRVEATASTITRGGVQCRHV